MANQNSHGAWIDQIFGAIGSYVHLETSDGVIRSGRLTGLRTKNIKFNGAPQEVVTEMELNADPADCVPVAQLESIKID